MHGLWHKHPTNWGLQWKVERQKPPLEGVQNEAAILRRGLQRAGVWRLAAQRTVYAGRVGHMRPSRRRVGQAEAAGVEL